MTLLSALGQEGKGLKGSHHYQKAEIKRIILSNAVGSVLWCTKSKQKVVTAATGRQGSRQRAATRTI